MRGWGVFLAAMAGGEAQTAFAQSLSGDIGIYNKYLDLDLFALTDEPVVQAVLYAGVSEECSLMVWGSRGLATKVGGELDLGAICYLPVGEGTVTVYALRSLLEGVADVTTVAIGYAHGNVDLTVEQYFWDGNADGTRVTAGYALHDRGRLTVRSIVTYERGLAVPEMVAAGISADYRLTDEISLVWLGLAPLIKDDLGIRSADAQIGLRYSF